MLRYTKRILYLTSIFTLILAFSMILKDENVEAADYTFPQYISYNGRIYKLNSKGSSVTDEMLQNINADQITHNCMNFKDTTFECTSGYEINISDTGKSGVLNGTTFTICPDADNRINFTTIQESEKMEVQPDGRVLVSFTFDTNLVYMRKLKKLDYYDDVGFQHDYKITGEDGTYDAIYDSNSFYINSGEDFYVEFYVRDTSDSICKGTPIGYVRDFDVDYSLNPVLNYQNDDGSYICGNLKSTCSKDGDTCDSATTGMVEYCFKDYVYRSENVPTKEEILHQINELKAYKEMINTPPSTTSSSTNLVCNFLPGSDNKSTTTSTTGIAAASNSGKYSTRKVYPTTTKNKYFQAVCDESLEVYYDDPKAVNAGGGFSYTSIIKITRTCTINKIRTVKKKPLCEMEPSCWGKHHAGEKVAGPNEDFDQCVERCDNGKYSQSCINSCYQEVYGNISSKGINYTDQPNLLGYNTNQTGILLMRSGGTLKKVNNCTVGKTKTKNGKVMASCYAITDNHGCSGSRAWCTLEHGTKVGFASSCNGTDVCYEVYKSSPDCSLTPEKDYYEEIQKAKAELASIASELGIKKNVEKSYESESIETGVYDDFYESHQDLPPHTKITLEVPTPEVIGTDLLGNVDQNDPKYPVTREDRTYNLFRYVSVKTEIVDLTQAYVSKESKQDNVVGTIYKNKKLDCNRDNANDTLCLKYYDGGYKYYTSLNAPEVNRWLDNWPYYNLNYQGDYSITGYKQNINVDLKKYGTWGQWDIGIDCMYGLYNDFYNEGTLDCKEGDICSSGIQYIYREIDLTDAFPNNRRARWNWTGEITNHLLPSGSKATTGAALPDDRSKLLYNVDPVALTKHIESNGYDVYDVKKDIGEVDYEFVLTRKNLSNIRQYNRNVKDFNKDGDGNYLDYDQSCYTMKSNGKERVICTSNFLDSEDYITYSSAGFTSTSRKQIAICNNARNQECYDISSSNSQEVTK